MLYESTGLALSRIDPWRLVVGTMLKNPKRRTALGRNVSRATEAYTIIRHKIFTAELSPGRAVSEYQLADNLGFSRTPVREALKRIENEGLIHSLPGRGTFVAETSLQDIVEIYVVRSLLEPFAARVAATQMSENDIQSLEREVDAARMAAQKSKFDEAFDLDIRLHKSIVAATRNSRINQILRQLDDQVHRIRVLAPRTPGRLVKTIDEHQAIVEALAAHDPSAAEQAMRDHLAAAQANAIRVAVPMPVSMDGLGSGLPSAPVARPTR
jgi:DNA-binding GntR family transcriptional regulator